MTRSGRKSPTAAFAVERHARILERLQLDGRLEATAIATEFGTSTETIRRDLLALENAGLLRRVHGGAVSEVPRDIVPDIRQRESLMTAEKAAIAEMAAKLVPITSVILMDGGTTTQALAAAFPVGSVTTVVTPSLTVATTLLKRPGTSVHTLGGDVSPRTWSEGGSWTIRALEDISADVVFLGCSGFAASSGATTSDQMDGDVKRAMIASARRVVMLADSSKIGSRHLYGFAHCNQIDQLITGKSADADELRRIAAAGVEIVQV